MSQRARTRAAVAAVLLALVLLLGGQALADSSVPSSAPNGAVTGQVVGRASFAYLTGLRQFIAAELWIRLDPIGDKYYGAGLGHDTFLLPNIKIITTLDPHLIEAYYIGPEVLIDSTKRPGVSPEVAKQRIKTAVALAAEGVTNNPHSGRLLGSYIVYLHTLVKNLPLAVHYSDIAMRPDTVWNADDQKFAGLAIVRDVYKAAGMTAKAAAVQAILTAIHENPNSTTAPSTG